MEHRTLAEVMTPQPIILNPADTCIDAANAMMTHDIGCVVLAEEDGKLCGIVTDRDLVVRVMAAGRDPSVVSQRHLGLVANVARTASPDHRRHRRRARADRPRPSAQWGPAARPREGDCPAGHGADVPGVR